MIDEQMCLLKYKSYHEKENKGVGTAIVVVVVVECGGGDCAYQ